MISLYLRSKPRYVALLLLLITTLGTAGLLTLPRLEDPTLSPRFAVLQTVVPGADALRVETEVTEVIEEELQDIEQLRLVRSQSRPGISVVILELKDHVADLENAWADVRERVDRAEVRLPTDASKPELETTDVRAYALIVALKWTSPQPVNQVILQRKSEILEDILLGIPGTEKVKIFGQSPEEISVLLDRLKLQRQRLDLRQVADSAEGQEARLATGELIGENFRHVLQTDTRFQSVDDVRRTPLVETPNGDYLALESLGEVRRGLQIPRPELVFVSGQPAIVLAVYAEDRVRVDRWTRSAKAALHSAPLPEGLETEILFEQNKTVEARLGTLAMNLLLAVAGVMIVVFLIMGFRASLVVGASIPLTSACVLGGLVLLGIPIHQMSVTGLIVALGLMIDNAIVITDEMKAERDSGHGRSESISTVVKRLTVPLISSTATTVLAFLPIALLPGGVGEFVGSIAVTVIIALLSSLVLSLTLLPVLFLWMEGPITSKLGFWEGESLVNLYRWLFRHPWTTTALALLLPVMGFLSLSTLKEQFFPPTDRAQIRMIIELPNSQTLEATRQASEVVRTRLLEYPEVEKVHWFLGRSVPKFYYNLTERREREPNFGEALIQLRTNVGTTSLIRTLQDDLGRSFPQYRPRVIQLEQGPPFDAPIELHLYGGDLSSQRQAGDLLRRALAEHPSVVATKATLSDDRAKLELQVDVIQARKAGLSPEQVAAFLALATVGRRVGTIFEDTEAVPVVLRLDDITRSRLENLDSLDIQTPRSGTVPLGSLVRWQTVPEQAVLAHRRQRRCNSVQAFLEAGTLPVTVLQPILDDLESGAIVLPPGVTYEIGGEAAERNRAVGNLVVYVAPLMVLMLSSLVVAFGSFRLAFLVGLVGLLSAGTGFGTLALLGIPFGFNAIIGTMGLLGVAINDSTVVLTALLEDAPEGGVEEIARTVARASRHVVATTFTTIAGFLPLLFGADRFWHPLAGVMAGGVGGATLLALLLCPVVYWRLMRDRP